MFIIIFISKINFILKIMNLKKNYLAIILHVSIAISIANAQINWQDDKSTGSKWALACDFKNNDLTNKLTSGSSCASTCMSTSGCTHFSWTPFNTNGNSGTCWMKQGNIKQSDAIYNGNTDMVCGIISSMFIKDLIFIF